MLKRPHYIVLALVTLLALIVLNLPSQTASRLRLAIGSFFLPLFGLASSAHQLVDKASNAVTPRSELEKEIETLRRENQTLRIEAMQAKELFRENARLRKEFAWQQSRPWKLRLAKVVLRDPANWWRTVQIDFGSRDGARVNLPVLTTEGLVGRISSVSLTRSQVVLVGDPNCRVAAVVDDETHDHGIVSANGPIKNSEVTLSCYLSQQPSLKPGQEVVTSGLGDVFPKGIVIGKIIDSSQVDYGLYTEARVKLAANLGSLEEVWVLFP